MRAFRLVTRGYIQSRDKDGSHLIRSAIMENPRLDANLSFIEPELWVIEVYSVGIRIFDLLASVTLTLTR